MTRALPRVLLFDSGVGGVSVMHAIQAARLPVQINYLADSAWLPYGEKSDAALLERIPALCVDAHRALSLDAIVIACNTASTIALEAVRAELQIPIVGVVPAIKPAAALTTSGVIGLLATPATVRRPYTNDLIARYAAGVTVVRHGDIDLVAAAEDKLAGHLPDLHRVRASLAKLIDQPGGDRIDVVVLACTHFPLLREELQAAAPQAITFLDSGAAIARRLAQVLGLDLEPTETILQHAFWTGAPTMRPVMQNAGFQSTTAIMATPPFFGQDAP
ncbi:MAG: glutamate racemase [Caulobacterales bacterium]|jgi:glutamate racemase